MKILLSIVLCLSAFSIQSQIYNKIENSTFFGEFNNGDPGDSIQVLISGQQNTGVNNGSVPGTYKLKIEGYQNDGGLVYPIHVSDENQSVDFYIRNRESASGIPLMFFGGDVYMGDFDNSAVRLEWRNNKGAFQVGRAIGTEWDNAGSYSFIAGNKNSADGFAASAFGQDNIAFGGGSITAGLSNTATGQSSAVFGENNSASGYSSAALGRINIVEGNYALSAGGTQLRVKSYSEAAVGRYNDTLSSNSVTSWNSNDMLFAAGNGSSESDRNNAFTIMKNGEAHFHKQDNKKHAILISHRDGPKYGGGGTFDFSDFSGGQDVGFVVEHRASLGLFESSGIYGDGDQVHVWSPGDDGRIFVVHDEDGMLGGTSEKWYIDGNGSPSALVEGPEQLHAGSFSGALDKIKTLKSLSYVIPQEEKDGIVVNEASKQLHLDPETLQAVLPELVDTKDNGQQYIKYHGVIVLLTEAVKEQQTIVEKLTEENHDLKKENEEFKKRFAKIEEMLEKL